MTLWEILKKIYRTNTTLYQKLREQSRIHQSVWNIDVSVLYKEVHREASPCFVLSTGRCGTKLLTEILQKSPNIRVLHTPTPEFTYYSEFAYHNAQSKPEIVSGIVDAARYELIRDAYLLNKKYVETNNRITFFCYALAKLFPKSNFVHLVRKPEEFITSGLARNWYSDSVLYDEGRIKPPEEQYSQIEKIAWLWNETNSFIEEFKNRQPSKRILTVRSDELFNSIETTNCIFDFLHLDSPEESSIRRIISKPVNKQSKNNIAKEAITEELLDKLAPLHSRYFK